MTEEHYKMLLAMMVETVASLRNDLNAAVEENEKLQAQLNADEKKETADA